MKQRFFVVQKTQSKNELPHSSPRGWHHQHLNPPILVVILSIATLLNGCENISFPQIIFESPKEGRAEEIRAYEEVTEVSHQERSQGAWFKVYAQASSLTQEERQARLLALNSILKQPDQNQTYLALEQATLLGVANAPQKKWGEAIEILSTLPEINPETDAGMYKSWLQTELNLRLKKASRIRALAFKNSKQANQIQLLSTEVNELKERIKALNDQINALTNIEQNLTEK